MISHIGNSGKGKLKVMESRSVVAWGWRAWTDFKEQEKSIGGGMALEMPCVLPYVYPVFSV